MSSSSRIGRDVAYLAFAPPVLLATLGWVLETVPMSAADQQGFAMLFGTWLAVASLGSIPLALVLSVVHFREWPLLLLSVLTAGLAAAVVTETDAAAPFALPYALTVMAAQALWFSWRRRRPAQTAPAGPLSLGLGD